MPIVNHIGQPPVPQGAPGEIERWAESRVRRHMLEECWEPELREYAASHLDPVTHNLRGPIRETANLFASVVGQLASIYDEDPVVAHPSNAEFPEDVRLWSQSQDMLTHMIGIREVLCYLRWVPENHLAKGTLKYEMVPTDHVVIRTLPTAPNVPARVEWAKLRTPIGKTDPEWTWDVWDVRDAAGAYFRIYDAKMQKDVTNQYMDAGDPLLQSYPYVWADGRPFLPFALGHARDKGLWDPYRLKSLVNGAFVAGLLEHYFLHGIRECAYQQRVGLDVVPSSVKTAPGAAGVLQQMVSDPSMVLMFDSRGEKQGKLEQWASPVDPVKMAEAIGRWEGRMLMALGLVPGDVERTEGAQSGFAIQLKQDAKDREARRVEPRARDFDLERIAKSAAILNRFLGAGLPEEGWTIEYTAMPGSAAAKMVTDDDTLALELDLITPVDLLRRAHPEMSEEDALTKLLANAEINRRLRGGSNERPNDDDTTDDTTGTGSTDADAEPDTGADERESRPEDSDSDRA